MYNVLSEYHINMIFRMLVSCLCGMIIGFERENRAKEAGIRTHCIVACASAMMMIISKYGFEDLIQAYTSADVRLDPSRMAQGIVTGVGFLGAGTIYVQRSIWKMVICHNGKNIRNGYRERLTESYAFWN